MFDLGGAIGAGMSAVGSIFGGISASKAMKKVKKNIEQQRVDNRNWYDRRYNEDATQRADAQAVLARTEESIRNRNRQAAGAQAVMGGTEESVAAAKAAGNEALAHAATNIAVNGEARKDAVESQYLQTDGALVDQLNNLERSKAANVSRAIGGVTEAASNLSDVLSGYGSKQG